MEIDSPRGLIDRIERVLGGDRCVETLSLSQGTRASQARWARSGQLRGNYRGRRGQHLCPSGETVISSENSRLVGVNEKSLSRVAG